MRGFSTNLGCTVAYDLRMVNGKVIKDKVQFIDCPADDVDLEV